MRPPVLMTLLGRLQIGQIARIGALSTVLSLAYGCGAGPTTPSPPTLTVSYDFRLGPQNWTCGAAEYLAGTSDSQFVIEYRSLQGELAELGAAWSLLALNNLSSDLFMFCKARLAGLTAGRTYAVDLSIEIATNTSPGCGGIGAPPGEGATIKAGMAALEPLQIVQGALIGISLDKGEGIQDSGREAVVIGNVAKAAPGPCSGGDSKPWEFKTLTKAAVPLVASTAGDGWLVAGVDMAFVGRLRVYLTKFHADLR